MVSKADIYEEVDARTDDMVAFLEEFIALDTENPPGRNYRAGAEFLADAMTERGYDVETVDVPESVVAEHYPDRTDHERVNVLGRKRGDEPGPDVHFTGHFDVVPAGEDWTYDPFDPVVEDGRIYGRGASDMKSGIAASLFAVDALEAAGVDVPGSVTQSMTVDEETGGFTGLGYLVDEGYVSPENTDYCVYTECFDSSRICLGHRGVLKFHVTAHGEKAHGCMAHDGENAVTAMHDFLGRVHEYESDLHARPTDLPVTPPESQRADISATMIDAGYSENVVPDRCRATFYRVLVPGESADDARTEIRELMDDAEAATGQAFEYEEIMFAEPAVVPEDAAVAEAFTANILEFYDDTTPVVSPGSDDQRFVVNDAGIEECIVYGPGLLDQAHVVDEYVPVEEVVTAAKVMAASTADLLGVAE
ncbi:ArgE/DapE family deacylase [Halobacterium bonnevillei]|uniref:ArgE/DapE family deacylase n=1 Tax=Halobacterium bonnevillei TaxID=2692200 RepID=A0A6B0SLN3_9EURY|nr:ArgE/DapE family deacylase [Halobacterium bonnevillei]MXR20413.1 ArgE/DapE family deacylase [Halobacterium bonnevillei]